MAASTEIPDGLSDTAAASDDAAWLPRELAHAPRNQPPAAVRAWFDAAAVAAIPEHDGTARRPARAYAHRAKAATPGWPPAPRCAPGAPGAINMPCRPAPPTSPPSSPARTAAAPASRRHPLSALHRRLPCAHRPGACGRAETMAGIHRTADQGALPAKKLAATADMLRQILAPFGSIPG